MIRREFRKYFNFHSLWISMTPITSSRNENNLHDFYKYSNTKRSRWRQSSRSFYNSSPCPFERRLRFPPGTKPRTFAPARLHSTARFSSKRFSLRLSAFQLPGDAIPPCVIGGGGGGGWSRRRLAPGKFAAYPLLPVSPLFQLYGNWRASEEFYGDRTSAESHGGGRTLPPPSLLLPRLFYARSTRMEKVSAKANSRFIKFLALAIPTPFVSLAKWKFLLYYIRPWACFQGRNSR